MSTNLVDLKARRDAAISKADRILTDAEASKRQLSTSENETVEGCRAEAGELDKEIKRFEQIKAYRSQQSIFSALSITPPISGRGSGHERMLPKVFSHEYASSFRDYLVSGGSNKLSASLVEGTTTAGGFAVPVEVAGQVVPLAPQDMAVRRLATVIPTTRDIKVPQGASKGAAASVPEGSAFTVTAPTLSQFTLSAFPIGAEEQTTMELAEDSPALMAFCVEDGSNALQELEETYFISGTGVNQPQGLIVAGPPSGGNIGPGVVEEPDSLGNLVSISGTHDLVGSLPARYLRNASFLMSRVTGIAIRKAQVGTNLYQPVWIRENGQDYLHGYPVEYSASMPSAVRGNTPLIFGDFKSGYAIGDRGGSVIFVKILDQALAAQGILVLLFFRRTDGRVRRSEALQPYYIAAS